MSKKTEVATEVNEVNEVNEVTEVQTDESPIIEEKEKTEVKNSNDQQKNVVYATLDMALAQLATFKALKETWGASDNDIVKASIIVAIENACPALVKITGQNDVNDLLACNMDFLTNQVNAYFKGEVFSFSYHSNTYTVDLDSLENPVYRSTVLATVQKNRFFQPFVIGLMQHIITPDLLENLQNMVSKKLASLTGKLGEDLAELEATHQQQIAELESQGSVLLAKLGDILVIDTSDDANLFVVKEGSAVSEFDVKVLAMLNETYSTLIAQYQTQYKILADKLGHMNELTSRDSLMAMIANAIAPYVASQGEVESAKNPSPTTTNAKNFSVGQTYSLTKRGKPATSPTKTSSHYWTATTSEAGTVFTSLCGNESVTVTGETAQTPTIQEFLRKLKGLDSKPPTSSILQEITDEQLVTLKAKLG